MNQAGEVLPLAQSTQVRTVWAPLLLPPWPEKANVAAKDQGKKS